MSSQTFLNQLSELKDSMRNVFSTLAGLYDKKVDVVDYAMPAGPKRLLVYYGYPVAYKGYWNPTQVINDIAARYDIWVCGDTYQDPTHEEYATTQTIISGLLAAGVEVWGYIPLGTNNYNLSLSQITTRVQEWNTLGVTGIFYDEFGFDYGSDRQRQIDAVNIAHTEGLPYCANAWIWEEVAIDNAANLPSGWAIDDWRRVRYEANNPTNLPLPRNSTDAYMLENWGCDNTGLSSKWDFHERAVLTKASNPDNLRLWGLGVLPENPVGTLDTTLTGPFKTPEVIDQYITLAGMVHGIDTVGIGGFSFGSGGTTVITTPRIRLPESFRGTTAGLPSVSYSTGEASTSFGENTVRVVSDEVSGTYFWEIESGAVLGESSVEDTSDRAIDFVRVPSGTTLGVRSVRLIPDNGTSTCTYSLPPTPADGQVVEWRASTTPFTTNELVFTRNGNTILDQNEDLTIDTDGSCGRLVWDAVEGTWMVDILGSSLEVGP